MTDITPTEAMKTHSDEAWEIASNYNHILASDTRTLAAQIDGAIAKARQEGVEAERERHAPI